MRVIVAGCGKIGGAVLESLVAEGHDVVAIDLKPGVITRVSNTYDVICVRGSATDYETLSDAGVKTADLFVATTGSDETNMLGCFIAKKMGAEHTVARIRNPEFNDKNLGFLKQQLDISLTINPELLAAQELYNILKLPSAAHIETFSRRNFEMIEYVLKKDTPLDGMTLSELRKKYTAKFLICVVSRDGTVYIPSGDFVLKAGDKIGMTAETTEIQKLLKQMGVLKKQARNVMILGASRIAYYLTKFLLKGGNSVKVIDRDSAKCEEFAKVFPDATVICATSSDQDALVEEGIDDCDAFVSLTGMDEENILISFFASSHNVATVIPKVNKNGHVKIAHKLGLDTVVSSKQTITDIVIRYARALQCSIDSNIETLYKLMDGEVEAIEFKVSPDFKLANIPLKDLKFKNNTLIAGILRGNKKSIIPTGEDSILPNDRVIIIAPSRCVSELSDIFE